ncbi:hypothetical protein BCR42DRAFT_402583 [Absidia repens]|uniref:GDP/GTP exchange factor Sec2 N-terminal domain-containing protein n=1 Tax=Absidia repens TaxID=90262 RepID=A0A1X2IYC9_9FUNG|nr:hypothetical protein BCR42DRAFT_402583 [Absidia repens]
MIPHVQTLSNNHPKDIAALFSQLQVSVDQAQFKTRLSNNTAYTTPLPDSSANNETNVPTMISPTTDRASLSSTSTTNNNSPETPHHSSLMTCPCYHWLVSMDSEHCAICDTSLEAMSLWQNERIERAKQLRGYRRQVMDVTATHDQQQNEMMALQQQLLEHREALMIREEELISLQQDMTLLQTKYNDESAQIEAIEISKQAAKREIEELGQHLFKEARDMVETEQQEKLTLESSCGELKQSLDQTQLELDRVGEQMQVLRMNMGRWGDHQDGQRRISANTNMTASPTALVFNHSNISENDTNDNGNTRSERSSITTPSPAPGAMDNTITISPGFAIPTTCQNFLTRAKIDLEALQHGGQHIYLNDNVQLETFEDDEQLLEFQEFMDSATSTSFSLRKLHGLPFIKLCLAEDIEPCLRFGPNPKTTNSKRILESIQIKTCFVEKCPPGFVRELAALLRKDRLTKKNKPSLWDKLASSLDDSAIATTASGGSAATTTTIVSTTTPATAAALVSSSSTTTTTTTASSSSTLSSSTSSSMMDQGHYISCATCGRRVLDNEEDASAMEKELAFRFRISYFDEWACIDRYCADRLKSVIAFYGFLRNLRLGTYKGRSLLEVYQECSRHRLLMFLSRLGALPLSSE